MYGNVSRFVCRVCICAASTSAFAQSIHIDSGSYGANCGARGASVNDTRNVTRALAQHCDGRATCRYAIAGMPAPTRERACAADFVANWSCPGGAAHSATVRAAAAHRDTLVLTCVPSTGAGK
jgi:hypothetical protein